MKASKKLWLESGNIVHTQKELWFLHLACPERATAHASEIRKMCIQYPEVWLRLLTVMIIMLMAVSASKTERVKEHSDEAAKLSAGVHPFTERMKKQPTLSRSCPDEAYIKES